MGGQYTASQQLIRNGIKIAFLYRGVVRSSAQSAEEMHLWGVKMTRDGSLVEFKDTYRATVNEFESIKTGSTDVTREYLVTFVQRMLRVQESGSQFEPWLAASGVVLGSADRMAFWRERFDADFALLRQFRVLLGSADKTTDFLVNTICE